MDWNRPNNPALSIELCNYRYTVGPKLFDQYIFTSHIYVYWKKMLGTSQLHCDKLFKNFVCETYLKPFQNKNQKRACMISYSVGLL